MSKETVTTPAPSIKDMVGVSGRIKRPRLEPGAQARTDRNGNAMGISTDIPDTPASMGDVREQIALNEASMREIIGAPIEADEVNELTSHSTPDQNSDAPDLASIPYVEGGAAEPGAPAPSPSPSDRNNQTGERPSIDRGGKMSVGTASTAPPAYTTSTEGSKPSMQTEHTAPATPAISTVSTEPSRASTSTPHTATAEQSIDSGDTAPTAPSLDTDPIRRTAKQRKSDLDEYRRRYMPIPRIKDRKPVFVSRTTRDRLDWIVRLLGERRMSVSGLVENIALRHLATHEPDIEHWRKI